jgi:hypothetical protein
MPQETAMNAQQPKDQRAEHQREDTASNPTGEPGLPQATTSPARPGKPGPRAPHAERGPGSAGADVGMSSDGGHAEDTTQARPDQTANERKR